MIKDRCCARPVVRRYIPFSPPTRKKKAKHLAAQACLLRITFTRLFDYEPPPPPTRSASRRLVALWNSTTCIYEFFFSFFSIYNLRRSPSNWFIIHLNFFSIQRGGRRRRGTWSLSLAIAGCWLSSRESFSLFLPLTLPLMWWTTRIIQLKTNLQRRREGKTFLLLLLRSRAVADRSAAQKSVALALLGSSSTKPRYIWMIILKGTYARVLFIGNPHSLYSCIGICIGNEALFILRWIHRWGQREGMRCCCRTGVWWCAGPHHVMDMPEAENRPATIRPVIKTSKPMMREMGKENTTTTTEKMALTDLSSPPPKKVHGKCINIFIK